MNPRPPAVVRYIRSALGPDADGLSDAALLSRFAHDRDEAAFELLVWRHAGAVLRACRGVLRDYHAAEDATQAAFLALARQAAAVGRRGTVAGWLFRVAHRIAARAARRRGKQLSPSSCDLDAIPNPGRPADDALDPETVRLLLEEVERLPEKYRAPVVLCFLDGLSHADAARRLGWPVGTVAGRIARAKELLHRRLTGRGAAVPAAGVGALAGASTAAAVPGAFVGATARAAVEFAAKRTVSGVSEQVLQLAKEATRAMTITKLQWAAGVLAAGAALTLGGVWAAGPGTAPKVMPAVPQPVAVGTVAPVPKTVAAELVERKATQTQRRRSLKNLTEIARAFENFATPNARFPSDLRDMNGKPYLSWRVLLLPYLGEADLYDEFNLKEPWDSEHNKKMLARMPAAYRVGFEPKDASNTYYQGFAGPDTVFGARELDFFLVTDGLSRTLGVVEAGPPVPWTKPADFPYDPKKPLPKLVGPFSNELHAVALDCAPHVLRRDIDPDVFRNLIVINDGMVTPPWEKLEAPMPAKTEQEKAEQFRLMIEQLDHAARQLRRDLGWTPDLSVPPAPKAPAKN